MNKKFALIGTAGYIASRHLKAIKETGGELVASFDIADSVGILDAYFPKSAFFTDEFKFYDYLIDVMPVDYLVICSPNFLHEQQCLAGLKLNADVICEKPLCLTLSEWQNLSEAQQYSDKKIYTILQLRHHPELTALIKDVSPDTTYEVEISYHTPRGNWYHQSWKGDKQKSGGIATNIGIHLFDLVCRLFGEATTIDVETETSTQSKGILHFNNTRVSWDLNIDAQNKASRSILINGKKIEFTEGFSDLHTASYRHILDGAGFVLDDVRPSIEIVEKIRLSSKR